MYNVGENMKEKRKKILLIFLLVVLIIVIIALSFAAFSYKKNGSENVITLGTLELTLNEGNTINLVDTYPLTDSEGLALTGYDFTLKYRYC